MKETSANSASSLQSQPSAEAAHGIPPSPLVGSHPAIVAIRQRIPQLAASEKPLVIVGEPGTGKTLIARHIHHHSGKTALLCIINLAILPDRDQRLELFGGEPPEFTSTYRGALEEETTVLIKNVDRASLYIRDRLSTGLSRGLLRRPGSSIDRPVQCRAIFTMAQTPRRLMRASSGDRSYGDFFRHLPLVVVPPLARRREDLPALLGSLMMRHHKLEQSVIHELAENLHDLSALLDVLYLPGRMSELEKSERRAFALIQRAISEGREFSLRTAVASLEAALARRALSSRGDCRQAVARRLGMSARTLERMSQLSKEA